MAARYEDCVFLNVPFDGGYEGMLRAMVFTVHDCGFVARCAREIDDSGQVRLDRIYELIAQSRYGLHDLSRISLDRQHRLPRFNMPLELGIFLGVTRFGAKRHKSKRCLILVRDRDRYQKYCSDIAGQDVRTHGGKIEGAVKAVRNWLSSQLTGRDIQIPGGRTLIERYARFRRQLPALCSAVRLDRSELLFNEYTNLVVYWLEANPWKAG
jgi:hypothetical protein